MIVRSGALLLALLASASAVQPPPAKPVDGAGSFFDPFDRIDSKRWFVSHGWVNADWQGCTWARDQVSVRKGVLQLGLIKGKNKLRDYRCAEIRTHARYGHGIYEARMRTATGSGLNSNMFTYSGKPLTPIHDEIDFEFLGKNTRTVDLNYFVSGKGDRGTVEKLPFDASQEFHSYAIVWMPNRIDWYIDGRLVRSAVGGAQPVTAGQFFLSLWNGTKIFDNWLGPFDPTKTPALAEVDWIGFTKDGERCKFPQSMTCSVNPYR